MQISFMNKLFTYHIIKPIFVFISVKLVHNHFLCSISIVLSDDEGVLDCFSTLISRHLYLPCPCGCVIPAQDTPAT